MKNIVIVAPHPDDEIISCFEILSTTKDNIIIVYGQTESQERCKETAQIRDEFPVVKSLFFLNEVPPQLLNMENVFYYPDPSTESHPLHRSKGATGELYARQGLDIIFYTTNMNTPYIHEVKMCNEKERVLDKIYPSQSSLWKYEKKYILFEGRTKWLF